MGRPCCSVLSTLSQSVPHRIGFLQLLDAFHQNRYHVTISPSVSNSELYVALVGRLFVRRWLFCGWYLNRDFRLHTGLLPMVRLRQESQTENKCFLTRI
jgi:hypothetical protein